MNYSRLGILLVSLIVAFILLSLGAAYYYWQGQKPNGGNPGHQTLTSQNQPKSEIISPFPTEPVATQTQTKTNEVTSLTDIPPLYPGLDWRQDTTNGTTHPYQILIDDEKLFPLTLDEQWIAETPNLNYQEWSRLVGGFDQYYSSVFSTLGWKFKVSSKSMMLEAPGAAGPTGNVDGVIGVKDGKLRVAIFQTETKFTSNNPGQCPCDLTFKVFLSAVIPLDGIKLFLSHHQQ